VLQLQIAKSAQEMLQLRPAWERLCDSGPTTIFQDFEWSRLAAEIFAGRESPCVIYAKASYGEAIIPAVLSERDGSPCIRLLGEELFDYRNFLHNGDDEVLRSALSLLSDLGRPLKVVALRQADAQSMPAELPLAPFTSAPAIRHQQLSADTFAQMHLRLARNIRRMEKLGFELRTCNGENSQLLRTIYEQKAAQDPRSLFHDPLRVQFMISAASRQPHRFEIFTLEDGGRLGAAVVTLLDRGVRRFYTCWFRPELSRHSPALSLIYEITRRSLAADLDCDYMTGEQSYKLRLATSAVQLLRLHATAEQLASLAQPTAPELRLAG
jgi:CelD/BcsL family acetyltransferase involved in cellulose biosynthesis